MVDLLALSYTGTHNPNRPVGDLVVDEVPGLSFALSAAPAVLPLEIEMLTGERREARVPVPGPVPALAVKALAYTSRLAAKDALDVWRLLEVAAAARTSPHEGRRRRASRRTPGAPSLVRHENGARCPRRIRRPSHPDPHRRTGSGTRTAALREYSRS